MELDMKRIVAIFQSKERHSNGDVAKAVVVVTMLRRKYEQKYEALLSFIIQEKYVTWQAVLEILFSGL